MIPSPQGMRLTRKNYTIRLERTAEDPFARDEADQEVKEIQVDK